MTAPHAPAHASTLAAGITSAPTSRVCGCTYRFDRFVLDPGGRTLRDDRDGQTLPLSLRAFDTLVTLVQHAGTVVSKDALLLAVWNGAAVEENNVTQAISTLRKALGDTSTPRRIIHTVPGHGYQFMPAVTAVDPHATPASAAAAAARGSRSHADANVDANAHAHAPAWRAMMMSGAAIASAVALVSWGAWRLVRRTDRDTQTSRDSKHQHHTNDIAPLHVVPRPDHDDAHSQRFRPR